VLAYTRLPPPTPAPWRMKRPLRSVICWMPCSFRSGIQRNLRTFQLLSAKSPGRHRLPISRTTTR